MPGENRVSFSDELSTILRGARVGEDVAEFAIHREFVDKLVVLASRRINKRFHSKIAPEEIVQSVFASFFKRHRHGEFECEDWNDLWALLVSITVRKCINKVNGLMTAKRDVRREIYAQSNSSCASSFFGQNAQPSAQDVAIFNDSLDQLFDQIPESLQRIVCMRLQGMSNFEISQSLNCSERTVYRSLNRIQKIFLSIDKS